MKKNECGTNAEPPTFGRSFVFLLNDGYIMIQYSVYSRICNGVDAVNKHITRLKKNIPSKGSVRYLQITEKQYCEMKFLVGSPKSQEKNINSGQLNVF